MLCFKYYQILRAFLTWALAAVVSLMFLSFKFVVRNIFSSSRRRNDRGQPIRRSLRLKRIQSFNKCSYTDKQTNRQTDKQTNRQAYKRFRSVDPFCLNLPSYNTNQLSVRDCFFFDTVLFIDLRSLQVDFSWISLLHRFFVVGIFQFRVNKILPVDDGQTKARRFEVACRTKWNLASDWLWK